MKKAILFFIATTIFSCEKREVDYTNQHLINEMQTHQITVLNQRLHKEIKSDEKLDKVLSEIEKLDKSFETLKDELIWVSGGYKDSISGELVNSTKSFYTQKYFYNKNFVRNNAINYYLYLIDKWDRLFLESDFESITNNSFEQYNKWFEVDKVSIGRKDLFEKLKPIETLIFISTIQRQLQVEKYNLLISQMEND